MSIEKNSRGFESVRREPESEKQKEVPPVKRVDTDANNVEQKKRLAQIRESLSEPTDLDTAYPKAFYGEFAHEEKQGNKVILSEAARQDVEKKADTFRSRAKIMTSIIKGEPIATEYDNRTNNFSTQTNIITLEDGRKVFAVYAHAGSTIHRILDTLMKWASGLKMSKVSRKKWKKAFEEKSNIPVIENADPYTVLLPFHSNVNAYDLMANNHSIEDFGENDWAKQVDLDEKIKLCEAIVRELSRVHGQGKAWGEAILPNIIFTKDKTPIICDPEIRYDDDISLMEAKARDVKDILISVCGALARSEQVTDFKPVITTLIETYGQPDVIAELKKLAGKKRTILQNITFGYEQVRSGTSSKKEYDTVLALIQAV